MRNIKQVGNDNLAPILLLDKEMEEIPEPFRMQNNVLLIVSFNEYLAFIKNYLDKVDYLSTPTSMLKRYVDRNDIPELTKAFFRDMAYAVAKELHYAEAVKKEATFIIHEMDCTNVLSTSQVQSMFMGIKAYTETEIYTYMQAKDFGLPRFFQEKNLFLWQYANVLYYFSKALGNSWVLNKEELI